MEKLMNMLVVTVLLVVFSSGAWGASNWSDAGSDHLWSNPDNWTAASSNAPPLAADTTYIRYSDLVAGGQGPLIQDGIDATVRNLSVEVGSGSLVEMTMTGGSLTIYNPGSTNCYFRLGAGASSGTVVFNMSGGELTVNQDNGANGYVRVGYGYTGQMHMSNDATITALDLLIAVDTGSLVDLSDNARIILAGDKTAAIEGFIAAEVLTSNGGTVKNVAYGYDSQANLTTITAIPEPGTLALLGLGGLIFSYRKR